MEILRVARFIIFSFVASRRVNNVRDLEKEIRAFGFKNAERNRDTTVYREIQNSILEQQRLRRLFNKLMITPS